MVRLERWWRGVGGEEFDIEGVGGVDGDHSFRVVIQIFEESFA